MTQREPLVRRSGTTALVFDSELWGGKDVGDNSQFWKPATLLKVYVGDYGEGLADVRFHHDGRESGGHYTAVMRDA